MALVNCTINSTSFAATKDQAFTSLISDKVLVITPASGFVCAASSFVVDGSLPTGVTSIKLSDSTNAFADDNTVLVTVDLDDSFVPTNDTVITIDIDGAAVTPDSLVPKITVSGNTNFDGTNVNVADSGPLPYSISSTTGNHEALFFNLTITANSGFYFDPNDITCVFPSNQGPSGSYRFVQSGQVYTNNRLTSLNIKVFYDFGDVGAGSSSSGHVINLAAAAKAIPTPSKLITNVSTDTSGFSGGAVRSLLVDGNVSDANCVITITRTSDSNTYDFTTDTFTSTSTSFAGAIGSTGILSKDIVYPANSSGDTYNISVTGDGTTTFTTQGANNDNTAFTLSLSEVTPISLTIDADSTQSDLSFTYTNCGPISLSPNSSYLSEFGDSSLLRSISISTTSSTAGRLLYLRDTTPSFNTDFDNNNGETNGGLYFEITKETISGNGTGTILFTGVLDVQNTGVTSVISSFLADNIINKPPVATPVTVANAVQVQNNTAASIQLVGTDPNNDTLTYAAASPNPSKGSVSINSSTGAAVYTPSGTSSSGADSFGFKVNDGFEDSSIAVVNLNIAAAGPSSSFSCNVVYKYKYFGNSAEYNLSSVFSGTLQTPNNLQASSSNNVQLQVSNWAVDDIHAGVPNYMDAVQDFNEVQYRLYDHFQNSVVVSGTIPIIYSGTGASSFNNSARTGTVNTSSVDTGQNQLGDVQHTLTIVLEYKDNSLI